MHETNIAAAGEEPNVTQQPDDDAMPTGQAFLDAYFTPELISEPD